jgi:two-component system NtrC family response regulator
MTPRVLLIDDDRNLNEILSAHLRGAGYLVSSFVNPEEGIAHLKEGGHDLVITDMKMEPFDGLAVLEETKRADAEVPVIMITAHATVENAVQSMKRGAYDYITKPFSRDEFLHIVANAIDHHRLVEENKNLRRDLSGRYNFSSIIGRSSAMTEVFDLMEKALDNDVTVLITGESGTGKELVSKAIHYSGMRKEKPFVVVNCASIPDTLIESELFGHVRGAFTGALRDRRGKFENADGGTIFLDEIGDLKLELQSKLLRVLQEGEVERVGEGKPHTVNVRVIAATHMDLEALVEKGLFREDLYYRVSVFPIRLPPLRERREDIPLLTEHFLKKHGASLPTAGMTAESLDLLVQYDWPGNVRELANVIERAVVLSRGGEIIPPHLPPKLLTVKRPESPLLDLPEEGIRLEELEKSLIEQALAKAKGNRARAARLLGISRPTLIYRIEKYGLGGEEKEEEGEK